MTPKVKVDQLNPIPEPPKPILTHRRLLGTRLYLHIVIRLVVAVSIVLATLFARHIINVEQINAPVLMAVAFVIACYDAAAYLLVRNHLGPDPTFAQYTLLIRVMYIAVVLDFLSLTVAIWLVGGGHSPFLSFYLLHVILSSVLLSRRGALLLTALAYALLTTLVLVDWSGLLVPDRPECGVTHSESISGQYALSILFSYGVMFGLTSFLMMSLSEALRRGERGLHQANQQLTKLSDMRRNFLKIALHNLQSPIGAVTMMLTNMRNGLGGEVTEQQDQWIGRSLTRMDDLTSFLKDLQMLSMLESGHIDTQSASIDLRPILLTLVEKNQDLADEHGHTMTIDLPETLPPVRGIETLLREAIVNYITNAIKFTPDEGTIIIAAHPADSVVRIEVQDNGVGISQADQQRLFSEFIRLKHTGTSVAKAKGSGLGLSIVKHVIETHGGRVGVESELNQGSTFYIELPIQTEPEA